MKKLLVLCLVLVSSSSFASVMGRYEGTNGTQIDFEVLTYMGGIGIDARLDPDQDSRNSAMQSVRMEKHQFDKLFDSSDEIEEMSLLSPFSATGSASGTQAKRTVVINESYIDGVLVSEKILTIKIKNGSIVSAELKTRKRRGLLNMVPLWMAKVFDEKIEVTKTQDGLLLRDDGVEICRVTSQTAIEQAQNSGSYSELNRICAEN